MTHMPLKKDCVLFTVISSELQYKWFIDSTNISQLELKVSWRLCMYAHVCGSFGRGKVLGCICSLCFFSSLSWISRSVTLSDLSHNLQSKSDNYIPLGIINKPFCCCNCSIPFWSHSCWWPVLEYRWTSGSWFLLSPLLLDLIWQTTWKGKKMF